MKKATKTMAYVLISSMLIVAAACGNHSNQERIEYSQAETNGSTDASPSSLSENSRNEDGGSVDISDEKKKTLPICNTKWTFTDAQGNEFVFEIKGMARNGKSAIAECFVNGKTIGNTTVDEKLVGLDYRFAGYEFGGMGRDYKIYFSPDRNTIDFTWFQYVIWDHEGGYLYRDLDAYDSESPTGRFKTKKIR